MICCVRDDSVDRQAQVGSQFELALAGVEQVAERDEELVVQLWRGKAKVSIHTRHFSVDYQTNFGLFHALDPLRESTTKCFLAMVTGNCPRDMIVDKGSARKSTGLIEFRCNRCTASLRDMIVDEDTALHRAYIDSRNARPHTAFT